MMLTKLTQHNLGNAACAQIEVQCKELEDRLFTAKQMQDQAEEQHKDMMSVQKCIIICKHIQKTVKMYNN